jgi:hypothetical protein
MAMFGTLGHIWGSNLALMAKFVVVEDFRGRNWHSWPDLGKENMSVAETRTTGQYCSPILFPQQLQLVPTGSCCLGSHGQTEHQVALVVVSEQNGSDKLNQIPCSFQQLKIMS